LSTAEKNASQRENQDNPLFYQSLIRESLDCIALADEKGFVSYITLSVKEILGFDPGDIIGRSLFEFVHPDDVSIATSNFHAEVLKKTEAKFINVRLRNKSKGFTWCLVRGHNMLHNRYVGKIVIYFSDDSFRKQAEEALAEKEKKLRMQATILSNVTDLIVTTDMNRVVTSWNKVIERLSGITAEEAIGRKMRDVLDTEYFPFTHDQVAEIVFKEGIWRGEVSFPGRDNERKHLLHTISLLRNEEGEAIGLLGIGKDITKRKKAEEGLQKSELFYRNLISNSLDGIIMTNAEGIITYCGPSVTKVSGYKPENLLGHYILEFVHPDESEQALKAFKEEVAGATTNNYLETRILNAENHWVWMSLRSHNLLNDPVFKSMVIYFSDITEQRKLSQRLIEQEIHKQKLLTEATIKGQEKERQQIGKELHDNINQHLTTARLYLEVASEKATGELQELIRLSLKNIGGMIKEIRALSQSLVPPTLGDIGLVESIQELCDSLKRAHTFSIDFVARHFDESVISDLVKLMLFRIIQEQVNNIIRHSHATAVSVKLQSDAETVILIISDNGTGFDPIKARKGMGLNNITSRATLVGGKAEFRAAPGQGCTLTVELPQSAGTEQKEI
jgi:PAS domain S-box-containing protein